MISVASRGRNYLYLGPDHVLMVTNAWFGEDYKRFYYRDIQAIVVQKNGAAGILNLVLGGLLAFLVFLAVLGLGSWQWDEVGFVITGIIFGIVLLLLLVNIAMGPTCICKLQTAVHAERLPSLGRLRRTRRAVQRIQMKVEEVQGRLEREVVEAHRDAIYSTTSVSAPVRGWKAVGPVRHEEARAHEALSYIVLVSGLVSLLKLLFPTWETTGVSVILVLIGLASVVVGIVRQNHSDLPRNLHTFLWSILIYGYITKLGELLFLGAEASGLFSFRLVETLSSFALGVTGIILVYSWRRLYRERMSAHPSLE